MISSKYWGEQMSKYWGEQRLNIGEENSSDSNKCVSIRLDALKNVNASLTFVQLAIFWN